MSNCLLCRTIVAVLTIPLVLGAGAFAPIAARYVRLRCDRRASPHGFSLWELEVFER